MRKIEMLLWVLGITSIVMKLNLVTGASMLLLVSFVGLAIVYFPFKNSIRKTIVNKATPLETDKSEREQNRILISFSGIGLSAICVGVVFKFLNLPGGTVNLIVGIALLLITIIYLMTKGTGIARHILLRSAIIGGFGVVLYLIPTMEIRKFQFRNYPNIVSLYQQIQEDPNNEELRLMAEIETNKVTMSEEEFKHYMEYMNTRDMK